MLSSAKYFASRVHGNLQGVVGTAASPRWLSVGTGSYFVIHTFSAEDSAAITDGLTRPESFKFTYYGNVQTKGGASGTEVTFEYTNPFDPNAEPDFDGEDSIAEIAQRNDVYTWDSQNVINRNLKFILHKQNDRWYLLYNFVHTRGFREVFHEIMSTSENVEWGLTQAADAGNMSLKRIFERYCESFVTHPENPTYLDPVCNMVLARRQCVDTAWFKDIKKEYTDADRSGGVQYALDAIDKDGENGVPHCLCMGKPRKYARDNLGNATAAGVVEGDSFLWEYQNSGQCASDITLTICDTEINAGNNATLDQSNIVQNCNAASHTQQQVTDNDAEDDSENVNSEDPGRNSEDPENVDSEYPGRNSEDPENVDSEYPGRNSEDPERDSGDPGRGSADSSTTGFEIKYVLYGALAVGAVFLVWKRRRAKK